MTVIKHSTILRAVRMADPHGNTYLPWDSKKRRRKKGETIKVSYPLRQPVWSRADIVGPAQGGPGIVTTTINGTTP